VLRPKPLWGKAWSPICFCFFDVAAEMDEQEEAAGVSMARDIFHSEKEIQEVEVLEVDPLADDELCADDY
jgi:hypothetical protein